MWHSMSIDDVRRKLSTDIKNGLTEVEAERRQKQYGKNEITQKKKVNIFVKFILQFNNFMIIILLIAAGISAAISYFEKSRRIYGFTNNYCYCCI